MRVIKLANAVKAFELDLTNRYLALGEAGFSDAGERSALRMKYAEITLGKNRLEWISDGADTPKYFPSLYVAFGAERSPIADARIASAQLHQAFLLGNDVVARNLFIGKYQGNFRSSNGKNLVLSLRGLDCKHTINMDAAIAACRSNGATHHLTTNAEYALLALKCKSQGFQPQGNNNFGKDEQGNYGDIVHQYTSGSTKYFGRVAQGSGPLTWFHDGSPLGVWGLNGNVYEWSPGYRLMDGKIQVIEYNAAALAATDMGASSIAWKGVLTDGTLVDPGTEGELLFGDQNAVGDNVINIAGGTWDGTNYFGRPFTSIEYAGFPAILKELGIIPHDTGDYGGDYQYFNFSGERCPYRGGNWNGGSFCGVWYVIINYTRANALNNFGLRPAFYELAA
ncbi:MAG: hypothetical protein VB076_05075 [Synergistaceae bacterium]|nr:hypothetical protein [Synergistaceae bacterium]